jgi:hypothetical protein
MEEEAWQLKQVSMPGLFAIELMDLLLRVLLTRHLMQIAFHGVPMLLVSFPITTSHSLVASSLLFGLVE